MDEKVKDLVSVPDVSTLLSSLTQGEAQGLPEGDKMPENVMDALRKNPYVALIVRWDGGDPVIIPALTALAKRSRRRLMAGFKIYKKSFF